MRPMTNGENVVVKNVVKNVVCSTFETTAVLLSNLIQLDSTRQKFDV